MKKWRSKERLWLSVIPKGIIAGYFFYKFFQAYTWIVYRHELDGVKKRHRSSSAIDQFMYAGPVFNNSPAPSTLPIPSFSPTYVSIEVNQPIHVSSPPPFSLEADLSEIQRKLRSLLKLWNSVHHTIVFIGIV